MTEQACRLLRRALIDSEVVVVYNPIFELLCEDLKKKGARIVYDCSDLYSGFSNRHSCAIDREQRMSVIADAVVVSSKPLLDHFREMSLEAIYIPNGVSSVFISSTSGIRSSNRPTAGYVGWLADWVDIDLLHRLAKTMPDWQFVVAGTGPLVRRVAAIDLPNFTFLGKVDYSQVPQLIDSFDVGLMPFYKNSLTDAALPLKLFEYTARGVPVVSTPIDAIDEFKEKFYTPATSTSEWKNAIECARQLYRSSDLKAFAAKNTWETRFPTLERVLFPS